jgi:hypothetical protein
MFQFQIKTNSCNLNRFRQTGLLLGKKDVNQNARCLVKRIVMISMVDLTIPSEDAINALQRRPGFKVSGFIHTYCNVLGFSDTNSFAD